MRIRELVHREWLNHVDERPSEEANGKTFCLGSNKIICLLRLSWILNEFPVSIFMKLSLVPVKPDLYSDTSVFLISTCNSITCY